MNKNNTGKYITFKGQYNRTLCNKDDFKMYAIDINKDDYPNIPLNKYGNVVICGDLFDLQYGLTYDITVHEEPLKYGYKVLNITYEKPRDEESIRTFLSEILTYRQAETILEHYPDILDIVNENRTDEVDLNRLKGIKEKTFAKIVKKIQYNYCLVDLVTEFKGFLSLSIIKKLYTEYSSIELLKSKLHKNAYHCLCNISGVGFLTADNILLELERVSKENMSNGERPIVEFKEDLKTSLERCKAAMQYILQKNEEEGHTQMNIVTLRNRCIDIVAECGDKFIDAIKDDVFYYNKENMEVSLKRTYDTECKICNALIKGLESDIKWDVDVEKYRTRGDCSCTDEQLNTLKLVSQHNVVVLNGSAGVGKSFSVQTLLELLKDLNKTYKLFTPTGKSSKVLADYTNEDAKTIHRGLGYRPDGTWTYNEHCKLDADVIIVDEFSMVDIYLMKTLLDAIDFNRTKLLMIGDASQLPSVGCGNIFHDLIQSNLIPVANLTKVFRYGEGGLMKIATDVRLCKPYLTKDMEHKGTIFGTNGDYTFIDVSNESLIDNIIALYKKLLSSGKTPSEIQVITSVNKGEYGTVALNNKIQAIANKNYGSEYKITCTQNNIEVSYYVGDLVIQKVNNYKALVVDDNGEEIYNRYDSDEPQTAFIANGESGIIRDVRTSFLVVDFNGIYIKYNKSDLNELGLGYALTVHKVQGSASNIVILVTPSAHTFMLNSNLIYVGLTRMRQKCFHLGNLKTVNMTIKKKANFSRNTFTQRLLREYTLNKQSQNTEFANNKHVSI